MKYLILSVLLEMSYWGARQETTLPLSRPDPKLIQYKLHKRPPLALSKPDELCLHIDNVMKIQTQNT